MFLDMGLSFLYIFAGGGDSYQKDRREKMKKVDLKKLLAISSLIILSGIFLLSGCAPKVNQLDPSIKGPQVVVNPSTVRLGVANLSKTNIVFKGSGFDPEDVVLVELLDVPVEGKKEKVVAGTAQVKDDGTFEAQVGMITKMSQFMRAKIDAFKGQIIVSKSKPPMPAGTYTAVTRTLYSDDTARCELTVKSPGMMGSFKDWIGTKMGKIVVKE